MEKQWWEILAINCNTCSKCKDGKCHSSDLRKDCRIAAEIAEKENGK